MQQHEFIGQICKFCGMTAATLQHHTYPTFMSHCSDSSYAMMQMFVTFVDVLPQEQADMRNSNIIWFINQSKRLSWKQRVLAKL